MFFESAALIMQRICPLFWLVFSLFALKYVTQGLKLKHLESFKKNYEHTFDQRKRQYIWKSKERGKIGKHTWDGVFFKSKIILKFLIHHSTVEFFFNYKIKNDSLVSTIFQISGSLKSKAELSQKLFYGKTALLPSIEKYYGKTIYKELSFNHAITSSQVQTDISINYCFYFCFYSFYRKNKSLNSAKASLIALKGRERAIFHIIHEIPWNLNSFGRRNLIPWLDHCESLDNALVKISIKGHNALWKSKQGSNLLSTSYDLGSKYAYNETPWKLDTRICFCHSY